jgi:hypothetical protein
MGYFKGFFDGAEVEVPLKIPRNATVYVLSKTKKYHTLSESEVHGIFMSLYSISDM